ncbi:type II secretion system protein [Bythopirellula goksoeyrii]|uniref:Type II secretion system protein G n=1 Tax=Bythopirellula goksoeyrii TaxID=1400387 RepID=A0A5B9QK64_9BACT|nr:type II secretion system protein [Bythopirellula goksoeyrii]QEG34493.1 hypothetical protein Pr1d_17730 [Bythopirellula goksoeyrii]
MGRKRSSEFGIRIAGYKGNQNPRFGLRNAHSAFRNPHSAFTLTELLVVITIIAILAALITAGAVNALNAAKRARISVEINQLAQSMEDFKVGKQYGIYPPNGMNDSSNSFLGNSIYQMTIKDFERAFKKAFPRHQEPLGLIQRLGGATGTLSNGNPSALDNGLNGAEAIYFWLGGFSDDPQYPISGPGGPSFISTSVDGEILESRNRIYEFDLARLGPRTDAGVFDGRFITYNDPKDPSIERQINLWTYNPSGSERPYVYFDASRHDPMEYCINMTGLATSPDQIYALTKLREGFSSTATPVAKDYVFVNKNKFQILHAGLDDAWGDMSPFAMTQSNLPLILFPEGPFTGDVADTLTNFTPGTLESAQE